MAAVTVEQRRSIITCEMPGEHTPESPPTLQDIAADRDWWLRDAGAHYRELAAWLRERAVRCRLPKPRSELLNLARRYERRAEQLERTARLKVCARGLVDVEEPARNAIGEDEGRE